MSGIEIIGLLQLLIYFVIAIMIILVAVAIVIGSIGRIKVKDDNPISEEDEDDPIKKY